MKLKQIKKEGFEGHSNNNRQITSKNIHNKSKWSEREQLRAEREEREKKNWSFNFNFQTFVFFLFFVPIFMAKCLNTIKYKWDRPKELSTWMSFVHFQSCHVFRWNISIACWKSFEHFGFYSDRFCMKWTNTPKRKKRDGKKERVKKENAAISSTRNDIRVYVCEWRTVKHDMDGSTLSLAFSQNVYSFSSTAKNN